MQCSLITIRTDPFPDGPAVKFKLCLGQIYKILFYLNDLADPSHFGYEFAPSTLIASSFNCPADIVEGESIITSRPELFLGNAMKSRIESAPPKIEQSLSKPNAIPA